MSKKYRGKHCVYCVGGLSTRSGDHIFARKFFLDERRDDLPKAPCCKPCNDKKSALEHYLTTVLPFGASHADALENLTQQVPPRLRKNLKLYKHLYLHQEDVFIKDNSGLLIPHSTIPIDVTKLEELFVLITKALANHHFQIKEHERVFFKPTLDVPNINGYFNGNAKSKIEKNIGSGTIVYRAIQAADNDKISAWEYTVYGGLQMTGCQSKKIVVFTGPEKIRDTARLRRKFRV